MRKLVLISGVAMLWLAACSDEPEGSEAAYCTDIGDHLDELNNPNITAATDVDQTVALYRMLRDSAPLAIEAEWVQLVANIETAASVVPGDPASVQQAADTARSAQQASARVALYTLQLCGVSLGGVTVPPPISAPPISTPATG